MNIEGNTDSKLKELRNCPNLDRIIRSTDTLHAAEGGVLAEGVSS